MNKHFSIIAKQLALGEANAFEFKALLNDETIGAVVCGLLNGQGGFVVIGVEDDGSVRGVENPQIAASSLEKHLKQSIKPTVLFSVDVQAFDGNFLIVVEVPSGKDIPYAYQDTIFIRKAATTRKADVETIRDMILRKQVAPERWERLFSPELTPSELSVAACRRLLKESPRLPGDVNEESDGLIHQLSLLSLAKYGRLTNAADVLLAQNPQKRHPQARVRAVAYHSKTDQNYQDLKHFEGPMLEVIEQVIGFILRNTPTKARFSNQSNQRDERSLYPEMAIREGVVNAFAHRDYASALGGIKVEVSADQVQIWNSGGFPEGVTVNKLAKGHISVLRNPDIAHALYLQGYMEKLGRGSVLITQACREAGLPDPVWQSKASGVTLTFKNMEATTEDAMEATAEVTTEVARLIEVMDAELSRDELQQKLGLRNNEHFRKHYLKPALIAGVVEMLYPDKPNSPKQKYLLSRLGRAIKLKSRS
ncbi:transcriptional regulator [Thiomicrospira aerophila AL3]|uniref:Transcriptional regulator n=1 Tax=Thiomicrospira aerophila AL3 TaxID=717772 RepID=W0DR72_9GAMM|nr:RNA-binding domain-containing protein [Thiomicrospira aerophila]AHF01120.1 transcriptional regulator [Thiomicrospira aerophila AL3]